MLVAPIARDLVEIRSGETLHVVDELPQDIRMLWRQSTPRR